VGRHRPARGAAVFVREAALFVLQAAPARGLVGFVGTRRRSPEGPAELARRAARRQAPGSGVGSARPGPPHVSTGPARETTRRSERREGVGASTSKIASTRVSDFCACCPPGPLDARTKLNFRERENDGTGHANRLAVHGRKFCWTSTVSSTSLANPSPAGRCRPALRANGHRIRFVTNNTTRSRAPWRRSCGPWGSS